MIYIIPIPADAAEDLINCTWENGEPLKQNVCDYLRERNAAEKAEREKAEKVRAEAIREESLRKAEREAIEQQDRKKASARREHEDSIIKAEQEKNRIENEQYEAEKNALKKICGSDYNSPRVGMTLSRARKCIGDLSISGQLNRKDGVVSIYQGQGIFIRTMNDQIISWGRN